MEMIVNDNLATLDDYNKIIIEKPYFKGRWDYFCEVIKLIKTLNLTGRVLELGAHGFPMVKNCDTMSIEIDSPNLTYYQDARDLPWRIYDKKYCLFIALQVWEHLGNQQQTVFKEVMRVSDRAILSFPYMWVNDDDIHNYIDGEKILSWTCNIKPNFIKHINKWVICYWEF